MFRGSLIFQAPPLPRERKPAGGSAAAYPTLKWPEYANCTKPVTFVRMANDHITGILYRDPELQPTEVRLTLATGAPVTWWKGVEVVSPVRDGIALPEARGNRGVAIMAGAYTQGSYHGPHASDTIDICKAESMELLLQFRKAGAFGIHMTAYTLPFRLQGGYELALKWECDSGPSEL